jgi:hypothetical protein
VGRSAGGGGRRDFEGPGGRGGERRGGRGEGRPGGGKHGGDRPGEVGECRQRVDDRLERMAERLERC